MKKSWKILISVLFSICLCLSLTACGLFGGSVSSSSGGDGSSSSGGGGSSSSGGNNNQPTEDSDGTFIYTGSSVKAASTSISGDIVIPSEHNGNPIDTIPANAFKGCTGITSITVPEEITSIGSGAFNNCSLLRSITLPFVGTTKGNTGKSALFGYIFGTASYQGGTKVCQYYGNGYGTYENYYIPSTLRSVTIADETILGYGAFYSCSMLTTIDLNDEILQIGVDSFYGCSRVEEINLPSITILPNYTFSGCIALKTFTINDSVDTIGASVFYGCTALSSVNSETAGTFIIPDTVTSIGSGVFHGCSLMKSITLPFIGSMRGNTGKYALFGYIFGTASYQGGTKVCQYYGNGYGTYENYYIPSTLRTVTITDESAIGYGAFYGCSMLETLTINSEAQVNIGTNAFYNCIQAEWN